MQKLTEEQIVSAINAGDLIECEIADGSFYLKIEAYSPVVCAAIHAGNKLRKHMSDICALNVEERRYEEDPFTEQFISAMPITLVGLDSRYEYDLNRPLSRCIYTKAWGKEVWKTAPSKKERQVSINKHQAFYRVLDAIVRALESRFGAILIFDVHSFNYLRWDRNTPTFNIGTEQIDLDKWSALVEYTRKKLADIDLPNIPVTAALNDVFYGRGYLSAHIDSRYQNSLVLPLEIKKIYMDELSGEIYPLVMQTLSQQLKEVLVEISALFAKRHITKRAIGQNKILATKVDPAVEKLDRELYSLAKGLETLHYINPINIQTEKKKFFKSNGNYQPQFQYRQLDIDPYKFRESLYRLPVDEIKDPGIQYLYRSVIDGLSEKIGFLVEAGKPQFLYESLKYYGEPSLTDEQNARFLLHASPLHEETEEYFSDADLVSMFMETAKAWNMECKVELSTKLVASAMVSNSRRAVMINKGIRLKKIEAMALVQHELGVHMATTLNSVKQKLKIFSLGLPGNTFTQEGLAILNEYQSGNMTLGRMKGLALRVLAVKEMLKYGDFRHTYSYLYEGCRLSEDESFKLALRVHRGGGFTKDYLYLKGVSQALDLIKQRDIRNLYVGKTGFSYLQIIDEMVDRQIVSAPIYYPEYLSKPVIPSAVLKYLVDCVRYNSSDVRNVSLGRTSIAA